LSSNVRKTRQDVSDLRHEIKGATDDIGRFNSAGTQGLGIVRRLTGGSEKIDDATRKTLQFINTMNMARHTFQLLLATTGPWGWAMLGISGIVTILGAADLAMEFE